MSVSARVPDDDEQIVCTGCLGAKGAPIAGVISIGDVSFSVCRDLANAVGFMCVRDGGWSKLEPRKPRKCT